MSSLINNCSRCGNISFIKQKPYNCIQCGYLNKLISPSASSSSVKLSKSSSVHIPNTIQIINPNETDDNSIIMIYSEKDIQKLLKTTGTKTIMQGIFDKIGRSTNDKGNPNTNIIKDILLLNTKYLFSNNYPIQIQLLEDSAYKDIVNDITINPFIPQSFNGYIWDLGVKIFKFIYKLRLEYLPYIEITFNRLTDYQVQNGLDIMRTTYIVANRQKDGQEQYLQGHLKSIYRIANDMFNKWVKEENERNQKKIITSNSKDDGDLIELIRMRHQGGNLRDMENIDYENYL